MLLVLVLALAVQGLLAEEPAPGTALRPSPAPVYTVAQYDPQRDPADDLEATVARAREEGKRILLEVGGDWCSWCRALDEFIHVRPVVASELQRNYLIMKVNYSLAQLNHGFLSQYPEISGYPHLFVLESDGQLLHSQPTGELEVGRSYDEQVVLSFLQKWAPPASAGGS